jgi:hypothetical protein
MMIMTDKVKSREGWYLGSIWLCPHLLKVACWEIVLIVIFFGSVRIVPGGVEEQGSISGIVRLNGEGVSDHRIMLIRFNSTGEVQRTPGQTNAVGQFTFENLETSEEFEYFVGIRYAGQLYKSEPIRLGAAQHRTGILVQVVASSEPTTAEAIEPPPLLIANHLVVLVLRDHHLEAREVVRILRKQVESQVGATTAPRPIQEALYLPLPHGYYNFAGVQGLIPEHVRLLPSGLHFVAPLESGEHRLVYTYSLPFQTTVSTMLTERSLPTTALDILIEDKDLVAVSDLQLMGRVSIEPHTFWHFRGVDLAINARSWLQVTRRNVPEPFLQVGAYVIVVGLSLFGIGLPLYTVWCRHAKREPYIVEDSGQRAALDTARVHLLQTIAHLDDQYQAGTIATSVYKQRRDECKKQLLDLVRQLRRAPSDKETSGGLF